MKRLCFLILITGLLTILSGCGLEPKTLSEFSENGFDDVTKIHILDGNSGAEKVTDDKKRIDDFLNEIKDVKFIPEENQEDRSGFNYGVTLYQEEEIVLSFSPNSVKGDYYYTEPDILPIIEDFYNNLEVKGE